jgi:protease I
MAGELQGKRVAFLVANEGAEQVELTEPWKAVEEAGGQPILVAPKSGKVQAFNHLDKGDTFTVDETLDTATPDRFDALVLPGGVANPDFLRMQPPAVHFVREFGESGKPIGVICHGPWTMIDAGLVRGRRLASWPSLRTDLTNAGAEWVDEQVVVDTNGPSPVVSSRRPDDLPSFCGQIVKVFSGRFART